MVRDKVLLFSVGLILLFVVSLIKPVSAVPATFTLSANPSSVTVTAGSSASTTITFHITSDPVLSPTITCIGLPSGASCSTSPSPLPTPLSDGSQFALIISAASSTSPGTYTVTVQATFSGPFIIQPSFLATSPIQFGSSGGIGSNSLLIQQVPPPSVQITVTVNPPLIPEYPLGLPILAIFTIIAYGLIKRRTRSPKII